MIMIRNTMFALSLLALTGTSAFAASKVVATHHASRTVAEGEAAPATDKPAKKEKKAKKEKAPKAEKDAAPKAETK
jgi:Skp family chaperone for outer membrane proteins